MVSRGDGNFALMSEIIIIMYYATANSYFSKLNFQSLYQNNISDAIYYLYL